MADHGTEPEPSNDGRMSDALVAVAELGDRDQHDTGEWARRLAQLARSLAASMRGTARSVRRTARVAGARGVARSAAGGRAGFRVLADALTDAAPRIPVRTRSALVYHYPDESEDAIAARLIASSARTSAAIGAAAGAVAAAEFAAPPALVAVPVQLGAETLAVAAVELKLLAELYELYGIPLPRSTRERTAIYLLSWAEQRAVTGTARAAPAALRNAVGRGLRTRLAKRYGRNIITVAPFLIGAAAGAEINRRGTRALGERLARQLRATSAE